MYILGSYQRPVGQDFFIAVSQSCVSRAVNEVCNIINVHLGPKFIAFPKPQERIAIKQRSLNKLITIKFNKFFFVFRFYEKFNIPGVIGLIDGTHITIKKPPVDVEHVYYATRKSCHTKNVQIVSFEFP